MLIPGNFKSNDFVSADSRGFTAPFFASADSKRLASVERRGRHRVRVSPFCKALRVSFTPHVTSAVIVVNAKMSCEKENAQNSQRGCETTGKVSSSWPECGLRVEERERNSTSATNSGPLARLLHLCDGWNGGCCRFLGESLPLTQTLLESLHQVRAHVDSAGLRPLWMRFGGIHVGEEIVFIRHELIPKRRRLL